MLMDGVLSKTMRSIMTNHGCASWEAERTSYSHTQVLE
jgi:hypothetical protein